MEANLRVAREGSKGLLVQIQYQNAKFTRESWLKADLAHQKRYLLREIQQKQEMYVLLLSCALCGKAQLTHSSPSINMTQSTLTRFGLPPTAGAPRRKPTMRSVAQAVMFVSRVRRLSQAWNEQRQIRADVRQAYLQTRGKHLP